MKGWRWTEVGLTPPWAMTEAKLVPRDNEPEGYFRLETSWGEQRQQAPDSDSAAVLDGYASLSMLSRITALPVESPEIDGHMQDLLGR